MLLAILVASHLLRAAELGGFRGGADFQKFHLSAERLWHGASPYWPNLPRLLADDPCHGSRGNEFRAVATSEVPPCLHPNLNPPIFAVLTIPLAWLSAERAWWCWSFLSLISVVVATGLLIGLPRGAASAEPLDAVWKSVALLSYFPLVASFELGQVTPFLLLLTVLSWRDARGGRWTRSGVWLGIAGAIKPFFMIFVITMLAIRAWRSLGALLVAFFGMVALGIGVAGVNVHIDYLQVLSGVTWTTSNWNASVRGFFERILGGGEGRSLIQAVHLGRLFVGAACLAVLATLWAVLTRCRSANRPIASDAAFALTLPAALLVSPLGWIYYFPLLLPTVLVLWRRGDGARTTRLLLGAALLPTAIPTGLSSSDQDWTTYEALWGSSVSFYCLVGLYLLCVGNFLAQCRRSYRPEDEEEAMERQPAILRVSRGSDLVRVNISASSKSPPRA